MLFETVFRQFFGMPHHAGVVDQKMNRFLVGFHIFNELFYRFDRRQIALTTNDVVVKRFVDDFLSRYFAFS